MASLTLHEIVAASRGRRRALGLSQDDLARRIGVSRKWIQDFERETGGASLGMVLRLLDVLELPLDFVRAGPSGAGAAAGAGGGARAGGSVDLDELLEQHRR